MEDFVDLIGYEGLYKINRGGDIWSCKTKKLLKYNLSDRYYTVRLYKNKIQNSCLLHRLLAIQFIPNDNPINKNKVDHIDRDKLNNSLENLRWVTQSQNCRNKKRKGGISLQKNNRGYEYWSCVYTYYENDKQIKLQKASKDKEVLEKWLEEVKQKYP
jgi:hypothetical protein